MISGCVFIGAIGVSTPMFGVGASTDPIFLYNLSCSGQENNISECNHSGVGNVFICVHGDDVGVICKGECTIYIQLEEYVLLYSMIVSFHEFTHSTNQLMYESAIN